MNLNAFYSELSNVPGETEVVIANDIFIGSGLENPHSYRGDYDEIALEPTNATSTAHQLLDSLDEIYGTYLQGWKGGDYYVLQGWKGGDYYVGGDEELYVSYEGQVSNLVIGRTDYNGSMLTITLEDE